MIAALSDAASVGGHFSIIKILLMIVMAVPWMLVAPWIHHDSKLIRAPQTAWSAGILAAGGVGFLIWLLMPFYALGLGVYVVFVGATLGAYLGYRSSRVDESMKLASGGFWQSFLGKPKSEKVKVVTQVKLYDDHARIVPPPKDDSPALERASYNAAQELLHDMMYRRAGEVDLVPAGQEARVRMVIDGVLGDHEPIDLATSDAIIQYLKAPAGMSLEERRRPQQGRIAMELDGKQTDVELTTAGTTGGQRMQFSIVEEVVRTDLEGLGLGGDLLERLRAIGDAGNGLLIVCSPPRNGMTSSLYALLRDQDAYVKQLVSLEAKTVVDLENVTQTEYGRDEDLPKALASAIRRDPDVIMIDRCPDQQTADMIREVTQTKYVMLGVKARDSFTAMAKWLKVAGSKQAVQTLRGVLCQVLLRKLCEDCREAYVPDPKMLAKANISASNVGSFYRRRVPPEVPTKDDPGPCPTCQESGYFGRTGAFEFMEITDEIRQLVVSGADVRQIKAACRKNKMLNLQEQSLRKVIAGITSIKEVIRVSQENKKRQ